MACEVVVMSPEVAAGALEERHIVQPFGNRGTGVRYVLEREERVRAVSG